MVRTSDIAAAVHQIAALMHEHRQDLIRLDQVAGDGDLGISMDEGFSALAEALADVPEDLGQALRSGAKTLNSAAPSSLGTILSFGLMGMAKPLRGLTEASPEQLAVALIAGVENIMSKAESAPGEKTVLDSLHPGAVAWREALDSGASCAEAAARAATAAAEGSEATRQMRAVHGRAAYSADRSIGQLDGGSVVGKLIFVGIARAVAGEGTSALHR